MNIYNPLRDYLKNKNSEMVTLTFSEMETIIGKLPASAYNSKLPWWENTLRHSQAKAWLEAGYTVKVNHEKKIASFNKSTEEKLLNGTKLNKGKKEHTDIIISDPKLVNFKKDYYVYLDEKANRVAIELANNRPATELLLDNIKELYQSAKIEKMFEGNKTTFEVAYHDPISSEFEFLLSRILVNYSKAKTLGWKIYLRRQFGKTAPDIRIEKNGRNLGIVEIKSKAGWIQTVFSPTRYARDMIKFQKEGRTDPRTLINRFKIQFEKYCQFYNIKNDCVFILLPSLKLVHRKRSTLVLRDYEAFFESKTNIPINSLILLSTNLSLDLSDNPNKAEYEITNRFETMVSNLTKLI